MGSSGGPASREEEARFGRGAWLTLLLAVTVLVGPLVVTLIGAARPTDGWAHTVDSAQTWEEPFRYQLAVNLTGQPASAREGDIIVAINGQPLTFGYRSAFLDDLQVGQTLRYTVLRDERLLEVDVPLVSFSPLMVIAYLGHVIQSDVTLITSHATTDTSILTPLLTLLIVGFAFARRPGSQAARLLLVSFAYFAGANWFGFANWDPFVYDYPAPLAFISAFGSYGWAWLFFPALTHLALVFPTRLRPLRRFPRLLPVLLYCLPGMLMVLATLLAMAGRPEALALDLPGTLGAVVLFVVTVLVGLIHNFRTVREPVARAQLRWIALGLGAGWGVGTSLNFLVIAAPAVRPLADNLTGYLFLLLPVSLAVAITRHRLFDIDVIINRALVYTLLTGILALVYVGGVALTQGLLRSLTGQESELAVVASTLAVAAGFQPLRSRIQAFIDRIFFRRKYDAARILAAYGVALRDDAEPKTLREGLLRVANETMRPVHLSLWLREPGDGR